MKSWGKTTALVAAAVVVVLGLAVLAVLLIDAATDRGRWDAAKDLVVPGVIGFAGVATAVAALASSHRAAKAAEQATGIAAAALQLEQMRAAEELHERSAAEARQDRADREDFAAEIAQWHIELVRKMSSIGGSLRDSLTTAELLSVRLELLPTAGSMPDAIRALAMVARRDSVSTLSMGADANETVPARLAELAARDRGFRDTVRAWVDDPDVAAVDLELLIESLREG